MFQGNASWEHNLRHSHLDPFKLGIQFDGKSYTVLVRFSCHCFTEGLDADEHDSQAIYRHEGEERVFSVDRHGLSCSLPDMIRSLGIGNMTVYHTRRNSFFSVRNVSPPAPYYMIFFRVYKAREKGIDVILEVISAYPKASMVRFASPVKFSRVIDSKARGKTTPLGKPCKVKRG